MRESQKIGANKTDGENGIPKKGQDDGIQRHGKRKD